MLKSISCEKLIKTPLNFGAGLNSVVGADDAHNSIGKSSVLMLIDFAFGGSDFPKKCDDVIRNVGHLKIGFEFEFDKIFSFVRDTDNPSEVYRVDSQDYISLDGFHQFLKDNYFYENQQLSFRECVSGFFRIYHRNNYDDKRPLEIVSKENWASIRKRSLKIFDKYKAISVLEKNKLAESSKSADIKATFRAGSVEKITKRTFKKNEFSISSVESEIESIKRALKDNVTDIKSIINERSFRLKREKDSLLDKKLRLKSSLSRLESNLSGNRARNSTSFQSIVEFFPEVDEERLMKVEGFHKGISKILRKQLLDEKSSIEENIEQAKRDISEIDKSLLEIAGSKEDSTYLLERLMELDREHRKLLQQNKYYSMGEETKKSIKGISEDIDDAIKGTVLEIEKNLNEGMKSYINKIYKENPISPVIEFLKGDYRFDHGDDRGTGKGYANMITLDLTFLEKTCLPCMIHDSVLFKNMDVPAIENLLDVYGLFDKQIFISIDEIKKYKKSTQDKIEKSRFIKLDKDLLAFKVKWKQADEKALSES